MEKIEKWGTGSQRDLFDEDQTYEEFERSLPW